MTEIEAGAQFSAPYPFVRDTYTRFDHDGPSETGTWRPGVRPEPASPEDDENVADAIGRITLTVVSTHKPGRFPMRVFFTRQWESPEGKTFGKPKLHIATVEKFRRLAAGYRHEFRLASDGSRARRITSTAVSLETFAECLNISAGDLRARLAAESGAS